MLFPKHVCKGHRTGDPTEPWVAYVKDCHVDMFIHFLSNMSTSNATVPSIWTAPRMGKFLAASEGMIPLMFMLGFFQLWAGEGMFCNVQQLRLHWIEVVAAVSLFFFWCLFLVQVSPQTPHN